MNIWEEYAANIASNWDLCANCERDSTGKKLFRQYNMYRLALGLAIADTPIDATEYAGGTNAGISYFPTPTPSMIYAFAGTQATTYYLLQIGKGLSNPIILGPPLPAGQWFPGDPWFDLLLPLLPPVNDDVLIPACTCTATGAPGGKRHIDLYHSP